MVANLGLQAFVPCDEKICSSGNFVGSDAFARFDVPDDASVRHDWREVKMELALNCNGCLRNRQSRAAETTANTV